MIRIAISLAALALLAACATAPQVVSPGALPEQKDGERARSVAPTWKSNSHIEIGGSM